MKTKIEEILRKDNSIDERSALINQLVKDEYLRGFDEGINVSLDIINRVKTLEKGGVSSERIIKSSD